LVAGCRLQQKGNTNLEVEMENASQRGRTQLAVCIASMVAALLLIALGVWLRGAEFRPITQLGRAVVFAALGFLAFRGLRWAKTLLVVWSAILALSFGVVAVSVGFTSVVWTVVALAFMSGAAYVTYVLGTSDAIEAFIAERARRDVTRHAP
jgi:hypothetical protein